MGWRWRHERRPPAGLERVAPRVPTLREYLDAKDGPNAAPGGSPSPTIATRGEDTIDDHDDHAADPEAG
jgi:hypothetical protein